MDDYVPKPVDPRRLFRTTETIVSALAARGERSTAVFDGKRALARVDGDPDLLGVLETLRCLASQPAPLQRVPLVP
jgi:hypothetical protein